ncbi:MAG TPA: DUF4340 domain-containing protein [Bdellovibrionota bacterium]|nr:DUF4340 domain-containing protein [Bdellovibrionota bacterium]
MTGPNWNRQLGLAVALVALGGAAVFYSYKYKPHEEEIAENSKLLLPFDDAAISELAVMGGTVNVRIKCTSTEAGMCKAGDQSNWDLLEPIKATADKSNVNSLMSTLKHLAATDIVDLKEEKAEKQAALMSEYGLGAKERQDPKTRHIELVLKSGKKITAWIGNPHPIGDKLFAATEIDGKLDTSRALLVPTYVKTNFEKDLSYWRDKTLITVAAHRVESFLLKNEHLEAEVTKVKGGWDLHVKKGSKTGDFPGDLENVDALITSVNYLRAKGFVSDDKNSPVGKAATAGLKQTVSFTVHFKKPEDGSKAQEPITLTLFEKPGKGKEGKAAEPERLFALASNMDPVFELEPGAKGRFNKELKDLRVTKLISSLERFGAKHLQFEGKPLGGQVLTLDQKNDKWAYAANAPAALKGKTPDDSAVQKLLDQLAANRIREFLDSVPAGESDGLTVTITGDDPAAARKWVIWKKDIKVYARDLKAAGKEAYGVDSLLADSLPWTVTGFEAKPAAAAPSPKAANPVMPPPMPGMPTGPGRPGNALPNVPIPPTHPGAVPPPHGKS